MATLIDIADKKACGNNVGINTGKLGCLSLFGTPLHLLAVRKGFTIPGTTNFDLAYLTTLVQNGTIVPLIDAASFEDISSEDSFSTNASGQKRINLLGLPEYKLMFEEGHEFYREIAKLTSYKAWDFIIGDEAGNWMMATTSTGDFKGFTAGQVVAEMRKTKVQGGDPESKSITVQFLDRLQWDKNYSIVHHENVDFTPQEVPQVNGATITFESVPADSDTTIDVFVALSSDETTPVLDLQATDMSISVNGVYSPVGTLVPKTEPGHYTATVPALATGEVVGLDLHDGNNNYHVIDKNGVLYRSEEEFITVIA